MKTWEKILLYPIGLYVWLRDQAKKTGQFIERTAKPAIAMLVAVTMMLLLMPMTAWAIEGPEPVGTWNIGQTNSADVVAKLYTNAEDDTKYDLVISGTGKMIFAISMPWETSYQDKIVSATIEDGVTNVTSYAFENATALKSVTFADSVEVIDDNAFPGCTSLASLDLNQVKTVGFGSFSDCSSLAQVNLGTVETIGRRAFDSCTSIETIRIPASTTSIYTSAFFDCTNFSAFTVDAQNDTYSAVDGVLFSKDGKTLMLYPFGKSGSSYTVPETVTAINNGAFDNALFEVPALTEITIPNHETTVGEGAIVGYKGGKTTIKAHSNSPAKTYADERAADYDDIIFESICTYDDAADTTCNVCGFERISTHSHPVCGKTHTNIGDHTACQELTWTAWDGTDITESGNYYLAEDVSIEKLTISQKLTVRLCLNGRTLRVKNRFTLQDRDISICDCTGGGVLAFGSASSFIQMQGISSSAILNLYGGTITGTTSYVVNQASGSCFHMYGGKIKGSGVYVNHGDFRMYGGEISESTQEGVFVTYGNVAIYDGAVISGNSSNNYGGGVTVFTNEATLEIHGGRITGNIKDGKECNVYLRSGSLIKIGEDLNENTLIGVTSESAPCTFSVGGAAYADKSYFKSDDSAYVVAVDGSNLKLAKQFAVSFNANGGTGSKDSVKVSGGDVYTLPSNPFTAPSGYQFKGWAESASGDVITTDQITVSADTTLYAIWEKLPAEAPSVQVSDNLTLTYGEFTGQKFVATVEQKNGYSYEYQWIDGNQVIERTDTLTIPDALAAGYYDYALGVIATRNDNGEKASNTIRDIWVKVNAKAIDNNSANVILSETELTYNGQDQKPAVTVTYNGKTLTEDTDYTLDWPADCKNVGSKTITVNFKGNYSGSAQKTFEIEKAPLTIAAKNKTITYGDAHANNGVTYSGFVSNENEDVLGGTLAYSYTYSQYGNVGAYDITVSGLTSDNYDITFVKGTLTVEQKQIGIAWGNTALTYNSTAQKPTATATGGVNGDELALAVSGAETNASDTAYTATVTAISGEKAANYKLPSSVTANFTIDKADQTAPVVNKENETISKKADGKLTGVTEAMEYRAEGVSTYTAITGNTVENLAAGKYFVRVKGDSNHNASDDTAVTIAAGKKLKVTVPQNQVGFTLTTTTPEIDYYGTIHVEFKLSDGYSMTENFEIYNGTEPVWQHFNQQTGVLEFTFVASDFELSVTGVADITAPTAEMDIKNNKWTSFWNNITFDLFFNETQDVTITANDLGSGVNTIQYYLTNGELELDEVKQITDWQDYNGTFKIDPNNHYVVYAKVTDNAGNTIYINSDGIILDDIAPTLEGIENGKTYYGDLTVIKSDEQFYDIKVVTLDGEEMRFAEGTYGLIPADNAEHIVVVQDHAGNKTTYTVTVMKNYTVTYKADGIVVGTQTVGHGKDATAPAIPQKDGYTQTAPTWDKDGKNITADTEINAVYTVNKYTVTYKADGEVVGTVTVEHGKDATAPAIPDKEGYTQTTPAWDKDSTSITADTEINAVYTINEYTITFMDENGVCRTLTFKHGEAVTMPEVPAKDGYTVTWETTIDKATGDATVKAVYTQNAVSDSPQTGDNSNMMLWITLLFVSGGALTALTVVDRKRRKAHK